MAGEGFMPGRGGGEAKEKPVCAGLATNPPPWPLVWRGGDTDYMIHRHTLGIMLSMQLKYRNLYSFIHQ